MRTTALFAFALLLPLLVGCATRPEDIRPAYVSETAYSGWTEQQMRAEQVRLVNALKSACAEQHKARAGDTVWVVLVGAPMDSMGGAGAKDEVAMIKGSIAAMDRAAVAAGVSLPKVDVAEIASRN